jgi:hypothetical protein
MEYGSHLKLTFSSSLTSILTIGKWWQQILAIWFEVAEKFNSSIWIWNWSEAQTTFPSCWNILPSSRAAPSCKQLALIKSELPTNYDSDLQNFLHVHSCKFYSLCLNIFIVGRPALPFAAWKSGTMGWFVLLDFKSTTGTWVWNYNWGQQRDRVAKQESELVAQEHRSLNYSKAFLKVSSPHFSTYLTFDA